MSDSILRVEHLTKWFPIRQGLTLKTKGYVKAVNDVSFSVRQGETLGLVGESGCGKSTLARVILRLIEATSGEVNYKGIDVLRADKRTLMSMRKSMQIIFQDPYGSLHPKMRIRTILEEPLIINRRGSKAERAERVRDLVRLVQLKEEHLERFPHEFSGGQRQRIVVARALATNPDLLVCDEPVSALDVSVRSQILNLLEDLQNQFGLTYLFISHDLSVVEHICDRVIVMYLGKIMELADKDALFGNASHPYTKALLSAVPVIGGGNRRKRVMLEGDIPSPANPPEGCPFRTRCTHATDICRFVPELRDIGGGHLVACHLNN